MCTTPWACRKVEAKKGFPSSTFMFLALLLRRGDGFTHPGPQRDGHLWEMSWCQERTTHLVFEGFIGPHGKLSIDPIYPIDSQIPGDREQILSQPETPAAISLPQLPCLLFIRVLRFSFMTLAINSPSGARERLLMCFR